MAKAPVSSIRLIADSTWWIAVLSKITTLLGLIPLKGSNWGCRRLQQIHRISHYLRYLV